MKSNAWMKSLLLKTSPFFLASLRRFCVGCSVFSPGILESRQGPSTPPSSSYVLDKLLDLLQHVGEISRHPANHISQGQKQNSQAEHRFDRLAFTVNVESRSDFADDAEAYIHKKESDQHRGA